MTQSPEPLKQYPKRDSLVEIELKFQKEWEMAKIFEVNSPAPNEPNQEKYMVKIG